MRGVKMTQFKRSYWQFSIACAIAIGRVKLDRYKIAQPRIVGNAIGLPQYSNGVSNMAITIKAKIAPVPIGHLVIEGLMDDDSSKDLSDRNG